MNRLPAPWWLGPVAYTRLLTVDGSESLRWLYGPVTVQGLVSACLRNTQPIWRLSPLPPHLALAKFSSTLSVWQACIRQAVFAATCQYLANEAVLRPQAAAWLGLPLFAEVKP